MKDDDSKRRRLISEQLKQKIKKKPYQQSIEGKQYIYSLLKKKNRSFFLSNERLFVLIGNEAVAYAREIPEHIHLPFYQQNSIPEFKASAPLSSINDLATNGQNLILQFTAQSKRQNWQFICGSAAVAQEWKQSILSSIRYLQIAEANTPIAVELPAQSTRLVNQAQNHTTTAQKPIVQTSFQPQDQIAQINFVKVAQNLQSASQLQTIPLQLPPEQNSFRQSQQKEKKVDWFEPQPKRLSEKKSNLAMNRTVDIQTEYYLKKKEEQEQKKQLETLQKLESRPPSVRKGIGVLTQLQWDYEFAKAENEYTVIEQFKKHVQTIATTLIDQLALNEGERQILPIWESSTAKKYRIGDINLEIYNFQLLELQQHDQRITVINGEECKRAQREFKNAKYILQMTRNKGRFRVPLNMMLQYKGFTVFAKASVHSTNEYAALAESLEWDVSQFQRQTQIERGVFQDESNVKVVAADQEWFQNMNSGQASLKRFDVCFLTEIRNFLPRDLHTIGKDGITSKCLRAELLQDEKYEDVLFAGEDISQSINKINVSSQKRKAIALLSDIGQLIPKELKLVAEKLANLDQVFTNSSEISAIMHDHGLNMRYLGQLTNLISVDWLRSLLMSEIIARSAKHFLKYELQQSTLTYKSRTVQQSQEILASQTIAWLNRFLGMGADTDSLWLQIQRQAAQKFKISIQKETANISFLVQALEYGCSFRLKSNLNTKPFFKTSNIFFRSDFQKFTTKAKIFDPSFTEHYQNLQNRLEDFSFQNYEHLSHLLNIEKREAIETHYTLNDMYQQIISFLSNWLSPQKAGFLYAQDFSNFPSKWLYHTQFTAIKWHLKSGIAEYIQKAQQLRDQLIQHINHWLGEFHPLLTDIYDIFSRYYLSCKQQKLAISFCRSSLKNQEKLLGSNHFKLADAYYCLGDIQVHCFKRMEGLVSYRKALQIIEQNGTSESQAFVEISNKLSQLYLQNRAIQQAVTQAKRSLALCERMNLRQGFLQAAEIIARCHQFEDNWQQYSSFADYLTSTVQLFTSSLDHLQRITKLIILPALRGLSVRNRVASAKFLAIVSGFNPRSSDWNEGYEYLKLKIAEKSFPGFMLECIVNAQRTIGELQVSGGAVRWRGLQQIGGRVGRQSHVQQFLGELQSLKWLLGVGFLQGVLQSEW